MASTQEEILSVLGGVVSEMAGLSASEVGPDTSFAAVGIGPLRLTEVVEAAEAQWNMGIPDQDINFTTLGDLADYVAHWLG